MALVLVGWALLGGDGRAAAQHAVDISLFAFIGGSTATQGHVRDAPVYGGITTSDLWCCEVGVVLEQGFNAALRQVGASASAAMRTTRCGRAIPTDR